MRVLRSLRRRSRDRIVAGVSGQLASRLGVEPVVVRLAFVVLAVAGGIGLVAYALGMLVLRDPDDEPAPGYRRGSAALRSLAVGAVVAGALIAARAGGLWFEDAIAWPVALGALVVAVVVLAVAPWRVPPATVGEALVDVGARVRARRGVRVEVVCVREFGVRGLEPLVAAARDAIRAAARRRGARVVRVVVDGDASAPVVVVTAEGPGPATGDDRVEVRLPAARAARVAGPSRRRRRARAVGA